MKAIEKIRISGMLARRPSASAIPIGIEATMPVTDTTSVTKRPPHSLVSTMGNPPWSNPIAAIDTDAGKDQEADDQGAPSPAKAAAQQEQQLRNNGGREGE